MIFRRLSVENFGLFCGRHEFDLSPRTKYRKRRPIILIGGKNGSGKTTFLEAILLCMYGKMSLAGRASNSEYSNYLEGRIHRPRGSEAIHLKRSSVSLDFTYTHLGEEQEFHVERCWRRQGDKIAEQLSLNRTDDDQDTFEESQAEDFLRSLIPQGVADLFFFDGEKIQQLADDERQGTALSDSVKAMVGLHLVDSLQSDLGLYLRRARKSELPSEIRSRMENLEQVIQGYEESIAEKRQDMASVEQKLSRLQYEIETEEQRLASRGGDVATRRGELKERSVKLQSDIQVYEAVIREEAAGLLPFGLLPELCRQLRSQLQLEDELQAWEGSRAIVRDVLESIQGRIQKALESSKIENGDLSEEIQKAVVEAVSLPERLEGLELVHELSGPVSREVGHWLSVGIAKSVRRTAKAGKKLEESLEALRVVNAEVDKIPSDEQVAPHIERLNDLNRRLGALQATFGTVEKELRQFQFHMDEQKRDYNKLVDGLTAQEDTDSKVDLAEKTRKVLETFAERSADAKAAQLAREVSRCYGLLCRKGDVIQSVDIDPNGFKVTVRNRENREIPKSELSAGEKQMYAIAMLWALARISGRPLPVIIDTPLGRLDSDHRSLLIANYFPNASHQVIILSTDTEVDEEYFRLLSPHISHAYHLSYDPETESSSASEGYFWRSESNQRESTNEDEQSTDLLRSVGTA